MRIMRKIFFIWLVLTITGVHTSFLYADDKISFTTSAPDAVVVGDQFRLSYTITTQEVRDFNAPSIKDFDVLMGPNRSTKSETQIINGNMTSTTSVTFTYILMASKEGTFTIPGATITANGNQMVSNSVQIKVLPADKTGNSSSGSGSNQKSSTKTTISSDDLIITGTVNKTNLYEQEAFILTYKIYTLVDLRGFDNIKLPDFKGFHSQEIELPTNRQWGLEHYKGRNYQTTIYRQFVLFPQQAGQLTIEAARFDASIQIATPALDPFDAFFNGGNSFTEVKKTIFTPKLSINVKALPANKPASFSGGVGEFNLSASLDKSDVKTNEAVTLKLTISGTGNLKLISNPKIEFPSDFETYDPKVDNDFHVTNSGLSGTKVIEYLAIPRHPGTYKIPSVEFSYFDIKSNSYKVLKTKEFELNVEKGTASEDINAVGYYTSNKEELEILNEDIRYIKQNEVTLSKRGDFFYGTLSYWAFYLIPSIILIVAFILYRKQIVANANIAMMRTKKANKVAIRRLKKAGSLLQKNEKDAFYDEVLKGLWGYVSDKLNIPMSKLSKDNITEKLHNYGLDDALIEEFLLMLDNCEFARFAPSSDNQAMGNIYTDALNVISKMENSIK